ncbi:Ger(x)C family spore germination protein [Bacillus sp. UNC438CL73TsuS30]|uniref:Ger(x)C family spore germination protein n=1 Tax=Bacillus sp. UNC438CL73TsuS30 TaxID=1340434 RepID=UPI000478E3BD|nr:Ger(x)C family spore germination protein [Bacillus sp. UNC438CL73TsuS30]
MRHRNSLCWLLCFSLLFITGCWDRKELNERAIWIATGWDADEKDKVEISGQIVIPSNLQSQNGGSGGAEKGYFTISASGKGFEDALQNLQHKLSREAFFGHRRVVFLGEEIAKRGLKKELDGITRAPDVNFRTDVVVVKGATAKEALLLSYPIEKPPASATYKENKQIGGRGDKAYLSFLTAANSKGFRPTMPAIKIVKSLDNENKDKDFSKPAVSMAGGAIFDKNLKLLGFLNLKENKDMLWVMGLLKKRTFTVPIDKGYSSLDLKKMKSKIKPIIRRNKKLGFVVSLTAEGTVFGNNTNLDLNQPNNLSFLEKKFEQQIREEILKTIRKVQKQYGVDIFGFGEVIHRKKPILWKALKKDWDLEFAKADISLKVDLKIKRIGMTGPSLLFDESEIKK